MVKINKKIIMTSYKCVLDFVCLVLHVGGAVEILPNVTDHVWALLIDTIKYHFSFYKILLLLKKLDVDI